MIRLPGSAEWLAHVAEMRAQESGQPEQWWWLSFGRPGKGNWLGGCFVRARGITSAIDEANRLGINPGGEIKSYPFGTETPDSPVNRLLSKDDIKLIKW